MWYIPRPTWTQASRCGNTFAFGCFDLKVRPGVGIHQCLSGLLLHKWACATLVLSFPQILPFNPYSTYNCYSPNLCKCTLTAVRTSPFSKWTRHLDNGESPVRWAKAWQSYKHKNWGLVPPLIWEQRPLKEQTRNTNDRKKPVSGFIE